MEFLWNPSDSCDYGHPTIKYNVCRRQGLSPFFHHDEAKRAASQPHNTHLGGFTLVPYDNWGQSLGPTQMAAYHACLDQRYPPDKRIPKVVWRGRSNNPFTPNSTTYDQTIRYRLHMLAVNHPDVLDTRIVGPASSVFPQVPGVGAKLNDTLGSSWVHIDDFNGYCGILDGDGNASWVAALDGAAAGALPHARAAPGQPLHVLRGPPLRARVHHFNRFDASMRTLVGLAMNLIQDCVEGGGARSRGQPRPADGAADAAGDTGVTPDHVGLAEAMAHTLATYANLSEWRVDPSVKGFKEVKGPCCQHAKLPKEVVKAMSREA